MPAIPDHLAAAYREEAAELIADVESALQDLGRAGGDADRIDRAFRTLQTIGGSSAMFGLDDLAAFSCEAAAVLGAVRDGWVRITPQLLALFLQAKDVLRTLLDGVPVPDAAGRARLVDALRAHMPCEEAMQPAGPPLPPPTPPPEGRKTFRLRLRPHPGLFRNGTNVLGLLGELRTMGRYAAVARSDSLPRLESLSPDTCYLGCDVILTTDRGLDAVLDAFTFIDGLCDLNVEVVDEERGRAGDTDVRLGQILIDRGEVRPEQLDRILAGRQRIGDLLAAEGLVSAEAIDAAVVEQKVVREERQRRDATLDRLVDLLSELVIAQARLMRIAGRIDDAELVRVSEDVERLLAQLRSGMLEVRRTPRP